MIEALHEAERRLEQLTQQQANTPNGPGLQQRLKWNKLRNARENLLKLIRTLRERLAQGGHGGLNAGGLVGRALCLSAGADLAAVAAAAVENGHSFWEELDIQDEADRAEAAKNGVHTTISCLGPFCVVTELDEHGNRLEYDPITGTHQPAEL